MLMSHRFILIPYSRSWCIDESITRIAQGKDSQVDRDRRPRKLPGVFRSELTESFPTTHPDHVLFYALSSASKEA